MTFKDFLKKYWGNIVYSVVLGTFFFGLIIWAFTVEPHTIRTYAVDTVSCIKAKVIVIHEDEDYDMAMNWYRSTDYECFCFLQIQTTPHTHIDEGLVITADDVVPGGIDFVDENGKKIHYDNIVKVTTGLDLDQNCKPIYNKKDK